jgi:CBS domain-containing protein
MKARDVMIPIRYFITPDNTIREAISLLIGAHKDLLNQGIRALPVLDSHRKLIGMLSEQDILKAVYPFYMSMADVGMFGWDGMLESMAASVGDQTVETYMSRDFPVIHQQASLITCVDLFVKRKINLLPVIDEANHVLGILHQQNIINVIARAILDEEQHGQESLPLNSPTLGQNEDKDALPMHRTSAPYSEPLFPWGSMVEAMRPR